MKVTLILPKMFCIKRIILWAVGKLFLFEMISLFSFWSSVSFFHYSFEYSCELSFNAIDSFILKYIFFM